MTKKCNKCKRIKNVSEFYSCGAKGGYKYICKLCSNEYNKRNHGIGSKHAEDTKKNSQRHRDEMSDMYVRGLIVKKTKGLNPEDIPYDLVKAYKVNLMLKRKLGLTNKKENK